MANRLCVRQSCFEWTKARIQEPHEYTRILIIKADKDPAAWSKPDPDAAIRAWMIDAHATSSQLDARFNFRMVSYGSVQPPLSKLENNFGVHRLTEIKVQIMEQLACENLAVRVCCGYLYRSRLHQT